MSHPPLPLAGEGWGEAVSKQRAATARTDRRMVSLLNKPYGVLCQFTDRSIPPKPTLADFVRQNLLALFAKGAKPVIGRKGVDHWILKDDYGTTPAQMADAVIEEWRASGAKDPKPYDSLWFALPKMYEELP